MNARLPIPALLTAAALATGLGAAQAQPPTPAPVQTRDFVTAAAQSDQFELVEGQVVSAQSRNPRVRAFAQQMMADHAGTSAALQQAAATSGLPPPPQGLDGDQQRMLSALQSLTGPAFDTAYARQQVLAHTKALTLEQRYAAAGPDANIRRVAQSAVPLIQHHLAMAQQLRGEVGGS